LVAHGSGPHGPRLRDLLVAEAFQEEQRDFAFGDTQSPAPELLVDQRAQSREQVPGLLPPAVTLFPRPLQRLTELGGFGQRVTFSPAQVEQLPQEHTQPDRTHRDDGGFDDCMTGRRPFEEIAGEIQRGQCRHGEKRRHPEVNPAPLGSYIRRNESRRCHGSRA